MPYFDIYGLNKRYLISMEMSNFGIYGLNKPKDGCSQKERAAQI